VGFKLLTIQFKNLLKTVVNFRVPELRENTYFNRKCRTMTQTFNRLPLIPEVQVLFQASLYRIYGTESDIRTGLRWSTAVSPFSITSPAFHTRISFMYCRRYTNLSTDSVVK